MSRSTAKDAALCHCSAVTAGRTGNFCERPPRNFPSSFPRSTKNYDCPHRWRRLLAYIREKRPNTEVLVVDDGSTDRTAAVAESWRDRIPQLRVLSNGIESRQRASACDTDRWKRVGDIVLFTDADLSAPIDEAEKLLAALKSHDVAIGSRAVDRSLIEVHESVFREFAGIIFNRIVRDHSAAAVCGYAVRFQGVPAGDAAGSFLSNRRLNGLGSIRNCCTWRGITGFRSRKFRCAGRIHRRRR